MKKYCIKYKNDDLSLEIVQKIHNGLQGQWQECTKSPDLCIVVGGDGTFLRAIASLKNIDQVSFVGIHTGTLGFFTDYQADEVTECINDILYKKPKIIANKLLKIEHEDEVYWAINEARIENSIQTLIVDVQIDGEYFETFRGTGLCISTQMGSTAYNRSIGGAIVFEGMSILQLSEIAGIHHRKYASIGSPLILADHQTITISGDNLDGSILCYDTLHKLLPKKTSITFSLTNKVVKMARYRSLKYTKRINSLF